MPTDHRAVLAAIRRFDQLIAYLRDEMGWPIARDSFDEVDDLFYDFTPEELGIDEKNAAKIQQIKRLRPLSVHQPFGIFFIKFEPKRLPVVALRRILSQVALKKRASANSAERAAWSADDLLFVSNYGNGESRQISFVHFSQNEAKKDLPTLKVLGWDNLDTALHLDDVSEKLTQLLAWPDDEEDVEKWRRQWRSAFTLTHREAINTSKRLSVELATLARNIRDRINTVLEIETDKGPVSILMAAFKTSLVHDLDEDGFADMYAQTIAYGLLSARVANPSGDTADDFAAAMPVTNPFLKELMETFLDVAGRKSRAGGSVGLDFDELGVSDVVELLDAANMEAVVRDFGDRNPQEDPVIHFYELFLTEYDAEKRMQRGVFYTPRPVVSYIVRSVDELLRTEFGLTDGLADITTRREMSERVDGLEIPNCKDADQSFVQILDPATGTGTFLVEVIDVIYKTMTEKWQSEGHNVKKADKLWNEYVPQYLLPRLHGYELMMAPYAIAHMKIGLKLYETGYRFGSDERARIYLTNSLEPAQDFSGTFAFAIPALAHEAEAVNAIKNDKRFTVVIGNPPYSGVSSNMSEYAQRLIEPYKQIDGKPLNERKHWLQDDYVKFIRLAQSLIDSSQCGVLGFITNHSYLDNTTFRGMRQSLLGSFPSLFAFDLHGSVKKVDQASEHKDDQNVFDIQQGVAILVAAAHNSSPTLIRHSDLWGTRKNKYVTLSSSSASQISAVSIEPNSPYYFFVPKNTEFELEYQKLHALNEIMPTYVCGITTARDAFVIDFDDENIIERVSAFLDEGKTDDEIRDELHLRENYAWRVHDARNQLRASGDWRDKLTDILYRPFDLRRIIYHPAVVWRTRDNVMREFADGTNIGLCTNRQVNSTFQHVGVTRDLINDCTLSLATKERTYVFPLWLKAQDSYGDLIREKPRLNFSNSFLSALAESLNVPQSEETRLPTGISGEQVVAYIYAVLHSVAYRERYAEQLKIDYPRIPICADNKLFFELVEVGEQLISLHLLESPTLDAPITTVIRRTNFRVEKVSYSDGTIWIDSSKTQGFQGVPESVWKFRLGGFQVCEKWIKDRQAKGGKNPRPGRILTDEDINRYQKIIVTLSETIRIMAEIDEVIEQHGGWPDAFEVQQADARDVPPMEAPEILRAAEGEAEYGDS